MDKNYLPKRLIAGDDPPYLLSIEMFYKSQSLANCLANPI